MPLNIVLDLSDDDLKYFSRVMNAVWKNNAARPERELIDGAKLHIKQARKAKEAEARQAAEAVTAAPGDGQAPPAQ